MRDGDVLSTVEGDGMFQTDAKWHQRISAERVVGQRRLVAAREVTWFSYAMSYRDRAKGVLSQILEELCADLDRQHFELGGLCVQLGED